MAGRAITLRDNEAPTLVEPFAQITKEDEKRILRSKKVVDYLKSNQVLRNMIFAEGQGEYALPPVSFATQPELPNLGPSDGLHILWKDYRRWQAVARLAQNDRGYIYDRTTGRYRDRRTGRLVSERSALAAVERSGTDFLEANISTYTERFLAGEITVDVWQRRVAAELKTNIVLSTIAGRGGRSETTNVDYLGAARELKFQYGRLDSFANGIAQNEWSAAYIRNRAKMYARSVRRAYFVAKTTAMQHGGFTHEQRFLQPGESCADCIGYANQGKQPIGRLPEPGQASVCRQNCNCIKRYFRDGE